MIPTWPDIMALSLVVCPYCNAQTAQPSSLVVGGKVRCPRCDESFVYRSAATAVSTEPSAAQDAGLPAAVADSSPALRPRLARWLQLAILSLVVFLASAALKFAWPQSNTTQRAFPFMVLISLGGGIASLWLWFLRKRRTNGTLATFVLANMVAVALMILPFALATKPFRRGNDPKPPALDDTQSPPKLVVHTVAPAALAGLGYLPDSCNVVAAIHVAELAEQPLGQKLLARPAADGTGEPPPWLLEQGLGRVEKLTGLKATDIDHVVFGTKGDAGLPTIILVVRTRQPYEPAAIARAQVPVVPVKHRDKDLYQFKLQLAGPGPIPFGGQGALWCADPQTLILLFNLALTPGDKDLLTDRARSGVEVPPRALRPFLAERLTTGTLIWWAATDVQRPELMGGLVPGGTKDAQLAMLVQKARSLTVGLRLAQDAAVLGNIECPDLTTAKALAQALEKQRIPGLEAPKIAGPSPDDLHPWLAFQIRGSPENVAATLRSLRLMGGPGKQ
jgi:hypothetical protein